MKKPMKPLVMPTTQERDKRGRAVDRSALRDVRGGADEYHELQFTY